MIFTALDDEPDQVPEEAISESQRGEWSCCRPGGRITSGFSTFGMSISPTLGLGERRRREGSVPG